MAVFEYRAREGVAVRRGTVTAETPRQARDRLRQRGLAVERVAPVRRGRPGRGGTLAGRWSTWGAGRVRRRLPPVLREVSTLLAVGVPALEALETVAAGQRGALRVALLGLRERVAGGGSLGAAMAEQPELFGELTVAIVEVGEQSGALDEALAHVAEFHEQRQRLRGRIGGALLYPAIVLTMGVGVSVFLMTFVVPNLLSALTEAGRPLPLATRWVKGASDLLLGWWWALALGLAAAAGVYRLSMASERGRWLRDRAVLRLPLVGELVRKQAVVRIAVVISTLMGGGVVFERAVRIAQRGTGNRVLRAALQRCEAAVCAGADLGPALEGTGVFPPAVVRVFAVGQHSGRLEPMLQRLAIDYDRQVAAATQRLTTALEPILILILAVVVGLIAFATVLPILEAGDVL